MTLVAVPAGVLVGATLDSVTVGETVETEAFFSHHFVAVLDTHCHESRATT